MNFLDLIKSTGYITVSKELAKEIGLNETIILSELISQYKYHKDRNELNQGWFYCTIDKLEKQTTLTKDQQNKAIKSLEKGNIIKKKLKGLPAKRHFKINQKEIKKLFINGKKGDDARNAQVEEKPQTGWRESRKQDGGKVANINNKNYNNNYNKKEEEEGELSTSNLSTKTKELFEQVFNQKMQPYHLNSIKDYNISEQLLRKGIEVSGKYNAQSFQYTIDLLKDWYKKGITTPEEFERFKRAYKDEENEEDLKRKGYR